MTESHRAKRVGEQLLAFLAEQIARFADPRVQFITLTGVEMTPDLKRARVYWTILADDADRFPTKEEISAAKEILTNGAGVLKRRIGAELQLRNTPQLMFIHDDSIARGARIDTLLDQAASSGGSHDG